MHRHARAPNSWELLPGGNCLLIQKEEQLFPIEKSHCALKKNIYIYVCIRSGNSIVLGYKATVMLRTPFHQTHLQPFPTSTSLLPSPHFADGSMVVPNLRAHFGRSGSQPPTGSTLMKAAGMIHPGHPEAVQFGCCHRGRQS